MTTKAVRLWSDRLGATILDEHRELDGTVVALTLGGPVPVRARVAEGEERDRLWQLWAAVDQQLDGYAGLRSTTTPVVVLEPRDEAPSQAAP